VGSKSPTLDETPPWRVDTSKFPLPKSVYQVKDSRESKDYSVPQITSSLFSYVKAWESIKLRNGALSSPEKVREWRTTDDFRYAVSANIVQINGDNSITGTYANNALITDKIYVHWDRCTYSCLPLPKVVDTTLLHKLSEASAITRSALM
jgi:hypothetical protein